ncbi:MAG: hypothetical protein RIQ47_1914 [Bacteroidota bacterium]
MSEYSNHREEVFSKSVRAGKRTYFFDVKSTKSNDYYLTITESKKRIGDDGSPFFEKHKIFLYREDFEKFMDGIKVAMDRIQSLQGVTPTPSSQESSSPYSNLDFDDLGK